MVVMGGSVADLPAVRRVHGLDRIMRGAWVGPCAPPAPRRVKALTPETR